MYDDTCEKVVNVAALVLEKIMGIMLLFLPILFSVYITLRICPSKLSADDMSFHSVVVMHCT